MADSMYSQRYHAEGPPPYHPCTINQWGSRVLSFSSEYDPTAWGANQILGPPKVYPRYGDIAGAWATSIMDAHQYIEIEFEVPVRPTELHIYETYNAGAIVRIKAREMTAHTWTLIWHTQGPNRMTTSRIFTPPLSTAAKSLKVSQIRIEVDCSLARNWCELDAVQLIGVRDGAVGAVDDTQFFADMSLLVNNKLHSDVMFNIDGKSVHGHKAILAARSPFFAKMFDAKNNANHAKLKLPNVSYEDIIAVLHFIYTNRLPEDCPFTRLAIMCRTSSMFELPELKTASMYRLVGGLNCENVVELFQEVQKESALEEIESLCRSFMASHLKEMSKVPAFETLPQSVIVAVVQEATMSLCLNDSPS